jgi:hypothetical protein
MQRTHKTTRILALMAVSSFALGLAACGQGGSAKTDPPKTESSAATSAEARDAALTLVTSQPPVVGQPVTVTLNLKGPDGKPLGPDAIATKHENKVHVMIVDAGLKDYTHVHATPGANPGEWNVPFTPKLARTYKVWTDFELGIDAPATKAKDEGHAHGEGGDHDHDAAKAADAHPHTPSADLLVGSDTPDVLAATQSLTSVVDGMTFTLSLGGAATKGQHVMTTLTVADAAGTPFAGLEPIMGAYAHLVGFSEGGASMLHGHPEGLEPKDKAARGGPILGFELHPKVSGTHRIFLQVQKGGKVLVVPFTLIVG